jgi:general secretion pathway protein B
MSYILDALRKADAQRERGSSRGIHAHPMPLDSGASGRGARSPWLWGLGAVVIAVLAAGWYVSRDGESSNPAPVVASAAPAAAATPPGSSAPAEQPAPVANVIVPPPPPPAAPQPVQAREAAFVQRVPRMGGMAPPPQPPSQQQQAQTPQLRAPASPPVQAGAQQQAAPALAGLPPDAPRVSISGGVYSPSPAQRMLIVNGQVFNEGSEVAPGLAIDEIKPRTAVLRFRGARYIVAY